MNQQERKQQPHLYSAQNKMELQGGNKHALVEVTYFIYTSNSPHNFISLYKNFDVQKTKQSL